ncbi:MAG: Gfo/Idh/MocA family protein [Candidatus Odinarchaeota archaeon]
MKKYQAIIIGAGKQGNEADHPGSENEHKIISFAHSFKEHEGFNLIGFIDKDFEKAKKAAKTWGAFFYANGISGYLSKIIENHNIVAVVTTPDDTHYEILKQLSEYPVKLVICEKPVCTDLQQAREIVKLYNNKGISLVVNYTRLFLPYYRELKDKYLNGEFGKFIGGHGIYNKGLLHTGSHMVNFIEWFFNKIPKDFYLRELTDANYRTWQIDLFFENYHWREERIGAMPVWKYYNKTHWHIVENAYNFLEGKELLKCTGKDALKTLEICYELMPNG